LVLSLDCKAIRRQRGQFRAFRTIVSRLMPTGFFPRMPRHSFADAKALPLVAAGFGIAG
jgi:hypothetical protein